MTCEDRTSWTLRFEVDVTKRLFKRQRQGAGGASSWVGSLGPAPLVAAAARGFGKRQVVTLPGRLSRRSRGTVAAFATRDRPGQRIWDWDEHKLHYKVRVTLSRE